MSESDRKEYNVLMKSIFGSDWKDVKEDGKSNNYIGALLHKGDFDYFKKTFCKMVEDLKEIYKGNQRETDNLIKTLRDVADKKNCNGAYAELCALHALNVEDFTIDTDVSLPASESFAAQMGHTANTNMDGHIRDTNFYFDTKAFGDTVGNILKNVASGAMNELKQCGLSLKKDPFISFEFPLNDSEQSYRDNVKELREEFKNKFKEGISQFKSDVIPSLKYVFNWGGVTSTMSEYNSYARAEELTDVVISRYADKYLLGKPFMLVLVNFAWYNQVDTGALGSNKEMYRALARRIFMQYRYSEHEMCEINNRFDSSDSTTIYDATKKLTALMFIDVHSAVEDGPVYHCYFYENPNADNKLGAARLYLDYLFLKHGDVEFKVNDNFNHDNY